jgi:hypothetical protein
MARFIRILVAALIIFAVTVAPALAMGGRGHHGGWGGRGGGGGGCVPEIDPSLAPSAIALLSGGLLILRSRRSGE